MLCRCRNCGKKYEESKSRAQFQGFCSAQCQHEKAWTLGYRKKKGWQPISQSEYSILKAANMIGSLTWRD